MNEGGHTLRIMVKRFTKVVTKCWNEEQDNNFCSMAGYRCGVETLRSSLLLLLPKLKSTPRVRAFKYMEMVLGFNCIGAAPPATWTTPFYTWSEYSMKVLIDRKF